MKAHSTDGDSPNAYSQLERASRQLSSICGAAVGAALPFVLIPSLSKASPAVCIVVLTTGCCLGWWIGVSIAGLSRRRVTLQRIIVRVARSTLTGAGILGLALSFCDLYHWAFLLNGGLLSDASFWGTFAFVTLSFSGVLSAGLGLIGLGFFTALLLVSGLYARDLGALLIELCWNTAAAFILVGLLIRRSPTDLDGSATA